MKGKLRKIIAGIATLAMAAQFAFVVPASAATDLPYSQDYNNVTDATSVWTPSSDYTAGLTLETDATHGNYIQYTTAGQNSRSAATTLDLDLSGKDKYVIEFDMALTKSNKDGSDFGIMTSTLPAKNSGVSSGYLFKLSMAGNSTNITLNGVDAATATLTNETWYHYNIIVDTQKKLSSVIIGETGQTPVVDKVVVPINGEVTDKIKGIHFLSGRYYSVMKFDNFVVREATPDDEFGEVGVEDMSTAYLTSQVNKAIVNPALGAENASHTQISVKVDGIYGSDLTNAEGIKYEWSINGLDGNAELGEQAEDGYISLTKEPGGGEGEMGGTEGDYPDESSSTAYFNVRNGVSDWFGSVNVKVTYHDKSITLTTPFATLRSANAGNNLAPKAGYPESMDDYKSAILGYQATSKDINSQDVVLNNWSIYGSNGSRSLTLLQDGYDAGTGTLGTGPKYLRFSTGGGSGSTVGVYQLANQASQYIVDMKVRGAITFGHYFNTPNNNSNDPSWTAVLSGDTLTVGAQTINGLNTTDWFRVVISADESAGTCWAKAYKDDGTLLGEISDEPLLSTATNNQKYFAFSVGGNIDIASFRIYYPQVGSMQINTEGNTEQVQVPAPDESQAGDQPVDEDGVFAYDRVAKKLTVSATDVTNATVIAAAYNGTKLSSVKAQNVTFTDGKAVLQNFVLSTDDKLYLWDGLETMKPILATPAEYEADPLPDAELDLVAVLATAEGFEITGPVTWELDTDDDTIQIEVDKDDSHKAKLIVKEGAPAGAVTITVRSGSSSVSKEINLTTSGNSIAVTAPVTSLTIPFSGEDAVSATFSAKTVDKNGADVQFALDENGDPTTTPAAITYRVLDKNYTDITDNLPAGVTISVVDGVATLTVTDAAKPAKIYVNAVNNDATPLSRAIAVNIHGLSFAFGSNEPAEGYTQVTSADSYSEKAGYGFADASVVSNGASNVSGSADYKFMVKVPNGNYAVSVTTSSATMQSEKIDSISTVEGIQKSGSSFNVAVVDGVLDLTFLSGSTLSELTINQSPAKSPLSKPAVYAIGDSTTKNGAGDQRSWGEAAGAVLSASFSDTFSSFNNHGQAGRDSVNFYNQGRIENVLLAVNPGDYVTVNMGINGTESSDTFITLMRDYYVKGIQQRGGIPVIVTATPDGPVGTAVSADYKPSNPVGQRFTNNRGTGARNGLLRKIAQELDLDIIELGYAGEAYFNELDLAGIEAYNAEHSTSFGSVLELVQSWYGDHNHYKEPLATWVANYNLTCLKEIANGSTAYNQANDPHINEQ